MVVSYDLGSGAAVMRSAEKLQLNDDHTLLARRFGRDGVLRVDSGGSVVSASSPGLLRSLNVWTPFYVGFLPHNVTSTPRSDTHIAVKL